MSEAENLQFKNRNRLNLNGIQNNTPIYRTYNIDHLITMIQSGENLLVRPKDWEDPFENFIFKQKANTKKGVHVDMTSIGDKFFGQCWTLNTKETDALWRIYSPDKNKVRIKSTIGKLWDSFYDAKNAAAIVSYYIGKISYEEEKIIKQYFEDPQNLHGSIFSGDNSVQAFLFMIKRMEFEHENELRIIYNDDGSHLGQKFYKHKINPKDFIEEVLFDPRFNDNVNDDFETRRISLINLGLNNIPIQKSTLYEIPNFNLYLDIDV